LSRAFVHESPERKQQADVMLEAMYDITDLNTTGIKQPGPAIKFEKEKFTKFMDKYNADKHRNI
jgi:hypothetical protein